MKKGKIELCGMRFFARHGCLESERAEGNEFLVDFSCDRDIEAAGITDDLADTLDYSRVYAIVAEEMQEPSNLLEHVAARIADRLERELELEGGFEVRVSKKNPPVGGECEWARVSVRR
jgi:dihydroneopterin aldolase